MTFWVLKLDKSIIVNDLHPKNIQLILVTFWVLKLDKSIFIKELHLKNIKLILVTFWVLKLDKSILINELHSLNKYAKLFILFLNEYSILNLPFSLNLYE